MKTLGIGLVLLVVAACSTSTPSDDHTRTPGSFLMKANQWKLISPQPKTGCWLWLSFGTDNKLIMGFREQRYEGYFEVDSLLNNYIRINIFNKQGWDEACDVNPEYLTLYDADTEFSYEVLEDRLYLKKNEKVIVFERYVETDQPGSI